jgi:nucleotide-binding universal stress UspA family protein
MHVLFATDGGDAALDAAALVVSIADRERTHITVLSVAPEGMPSLLYLDETWRPGTQRKANAEQAASDALRIFDEAGFDTHTIVTEGHPGREIIATAQRHAADLIVMGSGTTGLTGRLLGSVSNHVLHRTPSSVLIGRERPRPRPVRVVVGVDGSEGAEHALDVAMQFLDPQRCSITVLGVAELLTSTVAPPHVAHATSAPSPEMEARITQPAREHAAAAVDRLTDHGFDAQPHIVLGHPAKRLLSEIDNLDAGLAVVGSRGLDALDRIALGSVSDQLVRNAPATLVGH